MTIENERKHGRLKRLLIFAILVTVASFAFNYIDYGTLASWRIVRGLLGTRGLPEIGVYLAGYALATAAILVALFSQSSIVRWISLAIVFVFLGLEFSSRLVTGENIGFTQVHVTLFEFSFTGQFLKSYSTSVIKGFLFAGLLCGAVYAVVRFGRIRFALPWLGLLPVAFVAVYGIVWKTVAFTDVFPSPVRIPVLAAYAGLNSLYTEPREAVDLVPADVPRPRVMILVVDESVRGDFLGINGYRDETTPFLAATADDYLNFGVACAATNISSGSNAVLQSGLRAEDCPDRAQVALRSPGIFKYAKAAGYRTCFLDGQSPPGTLSNFMSEHDRDNIDVLYLATEDTSASGEKYERDRRMAAKVLELVAEGDPVYIYVNKYGAHFHYEETYPPDERVFTPTMQTQASMDASTLEEIENSFANSIRWHVDGFFEQLASTLGSDDVVLLYTSDHGQSFKERPGGSTHADRLDPPLNQANVPLLAWGTALRDRFPNGVEDHRDRMDHFRLFSTQLILMGYDETEVIDDYGAPLWAPPTDDRVFISGDLFGRGIVRINHFDAREER